MSADIIAITVRRRRHIPGAAMAMVAAAMVMAAGVIPGTGVRPALRSRTAPASLIAATEP
jgi:hypothetical protein